MKAFFACFPLVVACPTRLCGAQIPPTRAACDSLIRSAKTNPDAVLGWRGLDRCGNEGVEARAQLVRRIADRPDSTFYEAVREEVSTDRDQRIVDAAVELARNDAAPVPARIMGLQILVRLAYGRSSRITAGVPLERLDANHNCLVPGLTYLGSPEPDAVATARLRTTARSLADDLTEPLTIRFVALCLMRGFDRNYQLPVDVSKIRVENVCDTDYRIRNDAETPVIIRWEVPGTTAHDAGYGIEPHHQIKFFTGAPGIARFYVNNTLIAAVASSSRPCSP